MKLNKLALAIALVAVPFAAQAEFSVGGDVSIGYFQDADGKKSFGGQGSEVTFDAYEKVGGITYFGHFDVNVAGATVSETINVTGSSNEGGTIVRGGQLKSDDMYVGVRGGFGEVRIGDTDNGCDTVDTGWVADDEYISHSSGGCKAGDQNNITYKNTMGAVSYAVGYSPDVDSGGTTPGKNVFSAGVKGTMGPATVSLGYESDTANGKNVVVGVSGNFGPIAVGVRANQFENNDSNGEDTYIGYTAQYAANKNKFYLGVGDVSNNDTLFLGYQRGLGKNSFFIVEYLDDDSATDDQFAVTLKHSF